MDFNDSNWLGKHNDLSKNVMHYEIHGVRALGKVRLSHITNWVFTHRTCPRRSVRILNNAQS